VFAASKAVRGKGEAYSLEAAISAHHRRRPHFSRAASTLLCASRAGLADVVAILAAGAGRTLRMAAGDTPCIVAMTYALRARSP